MAALFRFWCSAPQVNEEAAQEVERRPAVATWQWPTCEDPSPSWTEFDEISSVMPVIEADLQAHTHDRIEWCVALKKQPGEVIGMVVDFFLDPTALHVVEIASEGIVAAWNKSVAKTQQVLEGDYITKVRGLTKSAGRFNFWASCDPSGLAKNSINMMALLEQGGEIELEVTRPLVFQVLVNLDQAIPLGLDVKFLLSSRSLMVTTVGNGAVSVWNAKRSEQRRPADWREILPGDRITGVNGKRGTAGELFEMIEKPGGQQLRLEVTRPSADVRVRPGRTRTPKSPASS